MSFFLSPRSFYLLLLTLVLYFSESAVENPKISGFCVSKSSFDVNLCRPNNIPATSPCKYLKPYMIIPVNEMKKSLWKEKGVNIQKISIYTLTLKLPGFLLFLDILLIRRQRLIHKGAWTPIIIKGQITRTRYILSYP